MLTGVKLKYDCIIIATDNRETHYQKAVVINKQYGDPELTNMN